MNVYSRTILITLCLGALTSAVFAHQNAPRTTRPTLAKAFDGDFIIGTALGERTLRGEDPISAPLLHQFNAFTAENAMKPDATQPSEGVFRFEQADKLVEIARKHNATVVGHTLVWHSQTPRWFFEGPDNKPASRELVLQRMRTRIAALVGRYKGKITQWDVVNEAISDGGTDMLRPSPWRTAIGDDYIAEAFRAAHAADPKATLVYNDYSIENPGKREKALKLLKSLRDAGVPVHAVGIQGHWGLDYPDRATLESAITDFAKLGLKVMITELDVSVLPTRYRGADVGVRQEQREADSDPYVAGLPEDAARRQAERYRDLFDLLRRHRDVVDRVTFWGVHDGQSWKNNFPIRGRTDYPLLFDRAGKPKPAVDALLALSNSR